jgi:hypothetical protein
MTYSGSFHGHLAILVTKECIQDGCFASRYIAQDGHVDGKVRSSRHDTTALPLVVTLLDLIICNITIVRVRVVLLLLLLYYGVFDEGMDRFGQHIFNCVTLLLTSRARTQTAYSSDRVKRKHRVRSDCKKRDSKHCFDKLTSRCNLVHACYTKSFGLKLLCIFRL